MKNKNFISKKLLRLTLSLFIVPTLFSCSKNETVLKEQYDTMYNHLVDCWSQSLEGLHFDNVFYGDSRVIGGDFTGFFETKSVLNLGVGGDKVKNLIDRYKLIETVEPDRVFLAIGGNDALSGSFNETIFKDEYTALLNLFKTNNVDVIVHNVVGITTVNSTLSQKDVDKANNKIKIVNDIIFEKANDFGFTFIDIASKMNKQNSLEMNGEYSADGVHFNEVGYSIWFDEIGDLVL